MNGLEYTEPGVRLFEEFLFGGMLLELDFADFAVGGFVGFESFLERFGELKGVFGSHDHEELLDRCKFSGSDFVNEREIELHVDLAVFDDGVVDIDDGPGGIRCSFDLASAG